ncbi:MAG: Gldg family protein [Candidatus Omnitrophica bacterium]|nr:Gldg family protein [Candidatus Omnitrophota bacterium]
MIKKKQITEFMFSTVGLAAMFLILVAVYLIAGAVKTRVDLTQEKLYTLSDGTKAILQKLDTPVEIRFYCSQSTMPVELKPHAQWVEDLLNEYRKAAKGKIEIRKFDPQPDSDAEDSANLDGIDGQMINTGDKVYLGIAVSCADAKATIPFLSPSRERLLEYDISRAISRVITPEKPVIGVMSALPVFGDFNPAMMQMGRAQRSNPWIFINELKRDYTVKEVEMTTDKIDDDIKVLLVVYPRDISDKAQFAIDQFVLRGGKLIAFLDPLSFVDSQRNASNPMQGAMSSGASLDKLLKAWGITFNQEKVLADMNYVSRLNRGGRAEEAPAVLSLTQDAVNTNDVVTSQIDSLLLPFAGVFSGTPADGLTETVLLKSSTDSELVEKILAQFSGESLAKDFTPSGKEQAIAIRLTGKFKTAFPDGKPKDTADNKDKGTDTKEAASEPALKVSAGSGVVVLMGDSDFLFDQVCAQVQNFFGQQIVIPQNGNLNLVENLVDQMAGDSNLIAVRSRATMNRPFTVVKKMQAQAEERYRTTIKDLEKRLSDTQQKMNELQSQKEGNQRFILSPEQQDAIKRFRQDEVNVNKELKEVRKKLRRDIDSLETRLEWINIAGMPFLVTISGVVLALFKRKRTAAK